MIFLSTQTNRPAHTADQNLLYSLFCSLQDGVFAPRLRPAKKGPRLPPALPCSRGETGLGLLPPCSDAVSAFPDERLRSRRSRRLRLCLWLEGVVRRFSASFRAGPGRWTSRNLFFHTRPTFPVCQKTGSFACLSSTNHILPQNTGAFQRQCGRKCCLWVFFRKSLKKSLPLPGGGGQIGAVWGESGQGFGGGGGLCYYYIRRRGALHPADRCPNLGSLCSPFCRLTATSSPGRGKSWPLAAVASVAFLTFNPAH